MTTQGIAGDVDFCIANYRLDRGLLEVLELRDLCERVSVSSDLEIRLDVAGIENVATTLGQSKRRLGASNREYVCVGISDVQQRRRKAAFVCNVSPKWVSTVVKRQVKVG